MITTNARKIGQEVCEALNLDPSKVISINVHFTGREIPKVVIEYFLNEADASSIASIIKEYHLVEKQ